MNLDSLKAKAIEAKRLADSATPSPWSPCLGSGVNECTAIHFEGDEQNPFGLFVCDLIPDYMLDKRHEKDREFKSDNMEFIAASRSLVPELADAVLELIDENEAWKAVTKGGLKATLETMQKLAIATEALKDISTGGCPERFLEVHAGYLMNKAREALAKIEWGE